MKADRHWDLVENLEKELENEMRELNYLENKF